MVTWWEWDPSRGWTTQFQFLTHQTVQWRPHPLWIGATLTQMETFDYRIRAITQNNSLLICGDLPLNGDKWILTMPTKRPIQHNRVPTVERLENKCLVRHHEKPDLKGKMSFISAGQHLVDWLLERSFTQPGCWVYTSLNMALVQIRFKWETGMRSSFNEYAQCYTH